MPPLPSRRASLPPLQAGEDEHVRGPLCLELLQKLCPRAPLFRAGWGALGGGMDFVFMDGGETVFLR